MDKAIATLQKHFTIPTPDTMESNQQCGTCWTDFSEDDQGVKLPCGHVFGEECILAWVRGTKPNGHYNSCPTCRAELLPPSLHSRAAGLVWCAAAIWQEVYSFIGVRRRLALFFVGVIVRAGARLLLDAASSEAIQPWLSPMIYILWLREFSKVIGWRGVLLAFLLAEATSLGLRAVRLFIAYTL